MVAFTMQLGLFFVDVESYSFESLDKKSSNFIEFVKCQFSDLS